MSEPRLTYTPIVGGAISIVPETDWEARLLDIVRAMRDNRKDMVMWYDWRANVLRIIPADNYRVIKLE